MTANLSHFGINADDVETARRFYQSVLGWTFTEWGPPGFFQISSGDDTNPGVQGALQQRRDLVAGQPTIGFECTFAVDDVDDVARQVAANGGTVLMDKTTITGVGDLIWCRDPSGNVFGAMRYDNNAE